MILTNPWIGYTDRSYLQIKQQIITKLQNPINGVTEITDYNDTNPFIKYISILAGIAENLGYYVDNKGQESFLMAAQLYKSAVQLARQYDYRIRGVVPAVGQAKFFIDNVVGVNIIVPINTEVQSAEGIKYLTTSPGTILAGQLDCTVDIKQWEAVPAFVWGQGTGNATQVIPLTSDVVDNSIGVLINNIDTYTPVDTFGPVLATDKVFKAGMNESYVMQIEFGDGITGVIPPLAQDIELTYYRSLGTFGRVPSGAINTINSVLAPPPGTVVKVTNVSGTTGGADPEALQELRKYIPLSLRTLYRAVTDDDFVDVLELAPGVARGGQNFICGMHIDLYIAPNGGGLAPPLLLTDTLAFMDRRAIIGRDLRMFSAGEVEIQYDITVKALPTFFNSDVLTDVQNVMLDFHSLTNQKISGAVYIGDIYEIIENLDKVDHCNVLQMVAQPYARPLNPTVPALVWTKTVNAASVFRTFRIVMQTTTTFKLIRDNVFLGIFSTGVLIPLTELDFTITGAYTIGDSWEFKTYPITDEVVLQEPSLPVTNLAALNITVTGGI